MDTLTYSKCDKLVWQVAHGIFKKIPKIITYYTFGGEIEDAYQQAWICLLEDSKTMKLLPNFDKHGGLIYTTVYRDMLDYIRSICGRENANSKKGISFKQKGIFNTINMDRFPMDSDATENPEGGISKEQAQIIANYEIGDKHDLDATNLILSKEIAEFMNKKLTVKDNYIARLLFAEGYTQKEVAKKLCISESRVCQIQQKFTETIQRHFT